MVNYAEIVNPWIYQVADLIRENINSDFLIEEKSDRNDLVTEIDQASERFIREKISEAFPDHKIMGEEAQGENVTSLNGDVWIIDPIDGTMNFIKMRDQFCVMIAYYKDGQGVFGAIYDVMHNDLYYAQKGQGAFHNGQALEPLSEKTLADSLIAINSNSLIKDLFNSQEIVHHSCGSRSYGSAGIETVHVIQGKVGAYISANLQPWDIAAGKVIADEMNLVYTRIDGSELDLTEANGILLSRQGLYEEIRNIISK